MTDSIGDITDIKQRFSLSGLRLPWPTNWAELFGRAAPLIMEIGFGGGTFLVDLARRHPDANIVGIEHSHFCLSETEGRVHKQRLDNVRLIHADALLAVAYICPPASIDALYINFPDPFPKTNHAHRRLLSAESLALIATRLAPGALLSIATDVNAYAESIAHDLAQTRGLLNRHSTAWLTALPGRIATRYERKAQELGATCHYFEWERTAAEPPPVEIPVQPADPDLEDAMPNIVLHSPLTLDDIAAAFQPVQYTAGEVHLNLQEMYQNRTHPGLLIDTFINEPLIEQRCGVAIVEHAAEPHRYVVRLSAVGHPRPTRGVHIAVRFVADWLNGLHPASRFLYEHVNTG